MTLRDISSCLTFCAFAELAGAFVLAAMGAHGTAGACAWVSAVMFAVGWAAGVRTTSKLTRYDP